MWAAQRILAASFSLIIAIPIALAKHTSGDDWNRDEEHGTQSTLRRRPSNDELPEPLPLAGEARNVGENRAQNRSGQHQDQDHIEQMLIEQAFTGRVVLLWLCWPDPPFGDILRGHWPLLSGRASVRSASRHVPSLGGDTCRRNGRGDGDVLDGVREPAPATHPQRVPPPGQWPSTPGPQQCESADPRHPTFVSASGSGARQPPPVQPRFGQRAFATTRTIADDPDAAIGERVLFVEHRRRTVPARLLELGSNQPATRIGFVQVLHLVALQSTRHLSPGDSASELNQLWASLSYKSATKEFTSGTGRWRRGIGATLPA